MGLMHFSLSWFSRLFWRPRLAQPTRHGHSSLPGSRSRFEPSGYIPAFLARSRKPPPVRSGQLSPSMARQHQHRHHPGEKHVRISLVSEPNRRKGPCLRLGFLWCFSRGSAKQHCLVCPGIGMATSCNQNTPEGMLEQIATSQKLGGDGVIFSSSSSLTREFLQKLKTLRD